MSLNKHFLKCKLQQVREEYGDTRQSLAQAVGCHYAAIHGFEKNLYTPKLLLLGLICERYRCKPSDLFDVDMEKLNRAVDKLKK